MTDKRNVNPLLNALEHTYNEAMLYGDYKLAEKTVNVWLGILLYRGMRLNDHHTR